MKPRTKLQVEVMEHSKQLPCLENKVLSWAKVECLEHVGYMTKSRVLCMDCGSSFSPELVKRKRAACPHCSAKLKVEQSKKRTNKQRECFAIAELIEEFQVVRHFEIFAYYKVASVPKYFIWEVLQHWILPSGKREVVARTHPQGNLAWCGDLEIRKKNIGSYYSYQLNECYPYKYHPDSVFKKEYQKYGIDSRLQGFTFLEAVKILPDSPKAETLLKARQYSFLSYYANYSSDVDKYWCSIKICLRNKYKVKDAKIWFDYIDLLQYFGKDLRNAHYVCPKNLNKSHNILVKKKRRILDKMAAERKRKKMLKDEKKFHELKSAFFGIAFTSKEIEIRVLESVRDVMKEGDALHHCVFTNEYYMKPDSLLFSAQVDGKRTETVEVDLKQFKVIQSRGLQNKNTEYHDKIISLVSKNMNVIKQRASVISFD